MSDHNHSPAASQQELPHAVIEDVLADVLIERRERVVLKAEDRSNMSLALARARKLFIIVKKK